MNTSRDDDEVLRGKIAQEWEDITDGIKWIEVDRKDLLLAPMGIDKAEKSTEYYPGAMFCKPTQIDEPSVIEVVRHVKNEDGSITPMTDCGKPRGKKPPEREKESVWLPVFPDSWVDDGVDVLDLDWEDCDMDPIFKDSFRKLTRLYKDTFSIGKELGTIKGVEMKIDTQGHPPIRLKPHRLGPEKMKVAEAEVMKMLEQNVVRRSYSYWSSPIVMVKKKDGSIRLCVDYRALNKITKDDNYPMPLIDDRVGTLHQAKWFSAMDLT